MSVPQQHILRKCRQRPLYSVHGVHPLLFLSPQDSHRGSVKDFVNFNAKQDAELLHKAMKGIGEFDALNVYKYNNTCNLADTF